MASEWLKVGERTSHEYGTWFYQKHAPRTDALRSVREGLAAAEASGDRDVLGEVDVAKERAWRSGRGESGLGRRPRNLEPKVPPAGEVLYSQAVETKQQETPKNEWEKEIGWVGRLGGERKSPGLSGLGRRLRGCEPTTEQLLSGANVLSYAG